MTFRPLIFDRDIPTLEVTSLGQALPESGDELSIFFPRSAAEEPNHRDRRLLCACGERPRHGGAAEQRYELAAPHSITSSARASSDDGTSRPSALAVLRFTTSSYLVGACTGRSAGFSPFRMRST